MQSFGLIGLLIVIGLAAWWLMGSGPAQPADSETGESATYSEVLNRAQEAADSMER